MDADPAADAEALDRLALWALQRYAPIVAADPPDGLVIDATGAAHLHGGEEAMLKAMVDRLAGVGHRRARCDRRQLGRGPRVCALCRAAHVSSSRRETSAAAALDLPIAAPSPAARHGREPSRARLRAHRRAWRHKPRAPLALRFGPELGRRLDQAMGRVSEPIDPVAPPDLIEVRRVFAEPIGAPETLARYTGKLVGQLCAALEAKGLGARRLDLLFHRVDNRIEAIRVGTALPVRDVKRLTRLLCDKIETIDPGLRHRDHAAGRDARRAARAETDDLVADRGARGGCLRPYRHPRQPRRRTAALSLRAGRERRAGTLGSADRADRARYRRDGLAGSLAAPVAPAAASRADRDASRSCPTIRRSAFTWRGIRRRVKRADGPERVFGEWWKRDAELIAVRDYFQVEDEAGERFWIYRAGDGEDAATGSQRWFLHGIFG